MRKLSSPATSMRSAVSERSWAISLFSMRSLEKRLPFRRCGIRRRFHMYEHVGHPWQAFFYGAADARGNFVRFAHSHFRIDFEMQVHIILQAAAAGKTFLDAERAVDGEGSAADFSHFGVVGHGVEELPDGAAYNLDGKKEDEEANQQATGMIGSGEANGIGKRKANRDEGNASGKQVGDVVPAIRM